jgi:hypothetical protein
MSALGQKQTFALQNVMSALPPKADMCTAHMNVRFGPKADIIFKMSSRNFQVPFGNWRVDLTRHVATTPSLFLGFVVD